MKNFTFYNPTKIQFGEGSISSLAKLIPHDATVLFAYGGGSIKSNGVYDQVTEQLNNVKVVEFGGIEANPEFSTLMKAVAAAKDAGVDFILAVGGGSVVDGAKFIAAAMHHDDDPWSILNGARVSKATPLGCILTLPATGSESNTSAVVNRQEMNQKKAFSSPHVQPTFAILDPTVTYSLPERQLINGVVDPFVHVIEQYLTYPVNATVQDRFAEGILMNLIDIGKDAINSQDYALRANLMWNATQALNGLIGVGVPQDWSTHMIGHELTAAYGLDHAVTLAIVLPRLMQQQRNTKRDKLLQYAQRVWQIDVSEPESAIDEVINKTEQFFHSLGMKTRLSDYGIGEEAIDTVQQGLVSNGYLQLGEQRDITPQVAGAIIKASL